MEKIAGFILSLFQLWPKNRSRGNLNIRQKNGTNFHNWNFTKCNLASNAWNNLIFEKSKRSVWLPLQNTLPTKPLLCSMNNLQSNKIPRNFSCTSFYFQLSECTLIIVSPPKINLFMEKRDANFVTTLPTLSVMILVIFNNLLVRQF